MGESSVLPLLIIILPFLISLLIFIGCAFGARAIMRSKGRSGAAGFFMGLFLGAIGVIIAAVLPADPEHEAEKFRNQMALMGISPEFAQDPRARSRPQAEFRPVSEQTVSPTIPRRPSPRPTTTHPLAKPAAAIPVAASSGLGMVVYVLFNSDDLVQPLVFLLSFGLSIIAIVGKSREMAGMALGVRLSYQFGAGLLLALGGGFSYFGWGLVIGYFVSDVLVLVGLGLATSISTSEKRVGGANPFALATAGVAGAAVLAVIFGVVAGPSSYDDYYFYSASTQEKIVVFIAVVLPIILAGLCITVPTRSRLVFAASYCIVSVLASTTSGLTAKWIDRADTGVVYLWTVALIGTAVLAIISIVSSQPDATSPIIRRPESAFRQIDQQPF